MRTVPEDVTDEVLDQVLTNLVERRGLPVILEALGLIAARIEDRRRYPDRARIREVVDREGTD